MQLTVRKTNYREVNLDSSKRMLIRIMNLLDVRPSKFGRFHNPQNKDNKWVWELLSNSNDPKRKIPIYFSVDQLTLESHLVITRRGKEESVTLDIKLPVEYNDITKKEVLQDLGF